MTLPMFTIACRGHLLLCGLLPGCHLGDCRVRGMVPGGDEEDHKLHQQLEELKDGQHREAEEEAQQSTNVRDKLCSLEK